ncbi:MAG: hypothetical protein ACRC0A_03485, partial [Chitinophagaceae bacterium]
MIIKKAVIRISINLLLLLIVIVLFSSTWFTSYQIGSFFSPFTGFWQNAESYKSIINKQYVIDAKNMDSTV